MAKKKRDKETVWERLDRIKREHGKRMYEEYIMEFGKAKTPKTH